MFWKGFVLLVEHKGSGYCAVLGSHQVSENLLMGTVLPVLCLSKMSSVCILYLIVSKFSNSSHVKFGIFYRCVFFLKEVHVHL